MAAKITLLICMTNLFMIILIPFVLFLSVHWEWNLPKPLFPISSRLQNLCIQRLEHAKNPNDLSASFICGKKLTNTGPKDLLLKSGIYHAIVVSGGHFLFLNTVLKKIAIPTGMRFLVLFAYYLMTGLQAPGLRCLTQMSLTKLTQKLHFKVNSATLCFYSGILCLTIAFPLWCSLSFWLSFSVSIALCLSQDLLSANDRTTKIFLPLFFIYLFLIPFNFSSGYLHPMNLILGVLLVYPFCCILFISSILLLLAHSFDSAYLFTITFDLNSFLYRILSKWTILIPDRNQGTLDLIFLWTYCLVLIGAIHILTIYFRRETIRV